LQHHACNPKKKATSYSKTNSKKEKGGKQKGEEPTGKKKQRTITDHFGGSRQVNTSGLQELLLKDVYAEPASEEGLGEDALSVLTRKVFAQDLICAEAEHQRQDGQCRLKRKVLAQGVICAEAEHQRQLITSYTSRLRPHTLVS